jgi:hypothetical protein
MSTITRLKAGLRQWRLDGGKITKAGTLRERYTKHMQRPTTSKSKAIWAKCCECSNCQPTEIRHCQVITCPLYPFRPYKPRQDC